MPAAPSNPAPAKRLYRFNEVTQALAIGRTMLYKLLAAGQLQAVPVGSTRRIPDWSIDEFLKNASAAAGGQG